MNKAIKSSIKRTLGFILSMIIILGCVVTTDISAKAVDTINVTGTIKSGSTSSLIKLDCDGAEMKIKIDENTDLSGCKVMLAGTKVEAAVYVGNDKYLHATKITATSGTATAATSGATVIISGNIKDGTTSNLIKLSTILGDFDIRFDSGTDITECSFIAVGRNIVVTCVKDNAGKLYATKISNGVNTATTSSSNTSTTTTNISGKIASNSNTSVLYVSNSSGTMTIKLDSDTDTSKGVVLATDSTVTVSVYTGSDGSLHAQKVVQSRSANSYKADTTKLYKISGTVAEGSTTDLIKFDMGDGSIMNLKLDDSTTASNGLILTKGTKITVTCGRGADAYMHAAKIEATK